MSRYSSNESPTICFCPLCQSSYTRSLLWTGRGIPHIYCDACKKIVSRKSSNSYMDMCSGESFRRKIMSVGKE